jgi:sialidase-1
MVDRVTGQVVLVFCRDNRQVFFARSGDDGATWSVPQEITASVTDPSWAWVGAGPGHGLQLASGRLLAPAWGDLTPGAMSARPDAEVVQF